MGPDRETEWPRASVKELRDGFYVNLGSAFRRWVSNHNPEGIAWQLPEPESGHARHGPLPLGGRGIPIYQVCRQADRTELPTTAASVSGQFAMCGRPISILSILPRRHAGGRERRSRQLDYPRQDGQGWAARWISSPASRRVVVGDGACRQVARSAAGIAQASSTGLTFTTALDTDPRRRTW